MFLYMYIALGQGQTTPWGQNFYININLLSLWSFAVSFFHPLTPQQFSPYKSIRDQIWTCCKIGQGQSRVIIWTNYDGPKAPMLIPSHKVIGLLVLEKIFEGFFTIYGLGGHLGHVTQTQRIFVPPSHWDSIWNLALIGPADLEKKIFENGGRTKDWRRSMPIL